MTETTVFLNPEDVERFMLFQKHHGLFVAMESAEIFDIGWGKATLNFAQGELQNIVKEEIKYKKQNI